MDEQVERAGPDRADESNGHAAELSAERLATRVAALRAQVRAMVPDNGRLPGAGGPSGEMRGSLERAEAFEQLLGQAREREDRLTTQTIHDQASLAAADARATEAERRLALVEAEIRARMVELSRLRSRCEWFEKDLDVLADVAAAAAAGAAGTTRLEKERDEARERALTERLLAARDRERAAEAERRVILVQDELLAARRQLAKATELNRRIGAAPESQKALGRVGSPSPWVELQHLASATQVEGTLEAEIVDLTEAESSGEERASEGPLASVEDEPSGDGEVRIRGGGPLRRLRKRRRSTPEPGGRASSSGS